MTRELSDIEREFATRVDRLADSLLLGNRHQHEDILSLALLAAAARLCAGQALREGASIERRAAEFATCAGALAHDAWSSAVLGALPPAGHA